VNGKLREEKRITVDGQPARRSVIDMPKDQVCVLLHVMRGDQLYQAIAVVSAGQENSPTVYRVVQGSVAPGPRRLPRLRRLYRRLRSLNARPWTGGLSDLIRRQGIQLWFCPLIYALPLDAPVPIVTKAKPRDLPVNLSCMSITSCTAPACAKSSCSSFSVVLKGRFPTYNLFPIEFILETPLGHCSRSSDFKSPLNKLN